MMQFTDFKGVESDSKYPTSVGTAKSSNLQTKIKRTKDQASKFNFQLDHNVEENELAQPQQFSNRILKMYDPSFLTHVMMSEADPLYNPYIVENKMFDSIQRTNALINQPPK